jgi:hypothetical protein
VQVRFGWSSKRSSSVAVVKNTAIGEFVSWKYFIASLGFAIVTSTQAVTSKWSPGSAYDLEGSITGVYFFYFYFFVQERM